VAAVSGPLGEDWCDRAVAPPAVCRAPAPAVARRLVLSAVPDTRYHNEAGVVLRWRSCGRCSVTGNTG
jgi:hypothetical protein